MPACCISCVLRCTRAFNHRSFLSRTAITVALWHAHFNTFVCCLCLLLLYTAQWLTYNYRYDTLFTLSLEGEYRCPSKVSRIAFSPDGRYVGAGSATGALVFWDTLPGAAGGQGSNSVTAAGKSPRSALASFSSSWLGGGGSDGSGSGSSSKNVCGVLKNVHKTPAVAVCWSGAASCSVVSCDKDMMVLWE